MAKKHTDEEAQDNISLGARISGGNRNQVRMKKGTYMVNICTIIIVLGSGRSWIIPHPK
jgi:hypothetical protein